MAKTGILRPRTSKEAHDLMKVSLGEEKADLVIVNGDVVNVYTAEILKDRAISVKGEWIAYVGQNAEDSIGPQTEVIDARGQTVIPGLIEGHTHIASLYTAYEFLKHVLPGGTTTIVAETYIIVVGANDADMAGAVNRIRALQGAVAVCDKGRILAELPLPVFGIMSDLPIEEIARRLRDIKKAVTDLGVHHPDPLLTLIALTGAAIPFLRICEEGLVNLKDGKTRPLIAED